MLIMCTGKKDNQTYIKTQFDLKRILGKLRCGFKRLQSKCSSSRTTVIMPDEGSFGSRSAPTILLAHEIDPARKPMRAPYHKMFEESKYRPSVTSFTIRPGPWALIGWLYHRPVPPERLDLVGSKIRQKLSNLSPSERHAIE